MKKLTDLPPEERPRERLLNKGARALADYELLAILLGKGTHKHDVFSISRRLIKIIDQKGINLGPGDILEVEGIGSAKATLIAAALEFVQQTNKTGRYEDKVSCRCVATHPAFCGPETGTLNLYLHKWSK